LHPRAGFLDRVERLASTLALWGTRTNLTARPGDPDEIAFHIVDSLASIALAPDDDKRDLVAVLLARDFPNEMVIDIGSGAGFPGLVLAAAFDARFVLIESRGKRASFLEIAAREMSLDNVIVERGRLRPGPLPGGEAGLVTARAFGTDANLYRIAATVLRPGGRLLIYTNPSQDLDLRAARAAGFAGPSVWTYPLWRGSGETLRASAMWRKEGEP
jgi:16S rRNA (guanine527-N7)-methyltransferase